MLRQLADEYNINMRS